MLDRCGPSAISWAHEDARDRWRAGGDFDVVYLDPMFGEHPKTALPAKQMQVLANLAGVMSAGEIVELIDRSASRGVFPRGRQTPGQRRSH